MCWYTDPLLKTCRHIVIKDIQKNISIGAYEHEMHGKQPVIINVEVFVQTENEKDQLDNAYNYDEVIQTIDAVLQGGHICLQETLIDKIANKLLNNQLVLAVLVRSEKTQAYPNVKSAAVEIFRTQHD